MPSVYTCFEETRCGEENRYLEGFFAKLYLMHRFMLISKEKLASLMTNL